MKLYLMRHGEPSYTACTQRGLIGQGRDLAALNEAGIEQVLASCEKNLMDVKSEVIFTSPYTRSLQTAALVAGRTGLLTKVVHDLHEWLPDTTFQYKTYQELKAIYADFYKHKGILPRNEDYSEYTRWEPLETFRKRIQTALAPYEKDYESAIVIAHGMVIQSLTGHLTKYGDVVCIAYDPEKPLDEWMFTAP